MNLDDIIIDIDVNQEEAESRWNFLLDEIMDGNVIPVIGPDFQVSDQMNMHEQLIHFFVK